MDILVPVLLLVVIAIICAVLLTVSSVFFAVKEDERAIAIREALPGANCGACGYSGCDSYAKALANGETDKTNLCIPGGDAVAKCVATLLGVEAEDVVEQVAYVACNGKCGRVEKKYDYQGVKTCASANLFFGGDKSCTSACLGYGDCMRACPQDAIYVEDYVARIDPRKCVGCGICVRECPNGIIRLINDTSRVVVECSNHEKGVITRKSCPNGCIGCMKCEKTCKFGAIKVIDNLATIDYSLCTGCAECVSVCPVHCIHEGNFICGAHF
ncbi:MAG: RnfABCDGE type electron transport complex subunit B [Clostridia bacterium]|nr:RnfABCDGE type electron transport complex subunit B [Clostridia bacterium]